LVILPTFVVVFWKNPYISPTKFENIFEKTKSASTTFSKREDELFMKEQI